jgi:hypothetical protein
MKWRSEPDQREGVDLREEDELEKCYRLMEQSLYNILICISVFTSTVHEQEKYIKDIVKTLQKVSLSSTYAFSNLLNV